MLLALKTNKEARKQGMGALKCIILYSLHKEHSSANTLILIQWDLGQTFITTEL